MSFDCFYSITVFFVLAEIGEKAGHDLIMYLLCIFVAPDVYGRSVANMRDDVIKRKHFPRYWPFVRVFCPSPVISPHRGQWRGALLFSLIWAFTNSWVNNRDAGDLKRHGANYDVIVIGVSIVNYVTPDHCNSHIQSHIQPLLMTLGPYKFDIRHTCRTLSFAEMI